MKILIFTIAIPVFILLSVRYFEQKNLYFPFKEIEATPENIGLDFEEIALTSGDGVSISGWFIPSVSSRAVLIFCHGNGGNISHRLEKIRILNELGLDVLIFDYRGYGKSEGRPSEAGLYLDTEAMYEYLVKEKAILSRKIIGYGESLGGAVVINLAVNREMGGVIIEDSFTSVREMGKKLFPFVPAFLYKSRYDSIGKIQHIKIPKLIFHSINDEIIPFEQGKRLYDVSPEPKEFVQLNGGHNDAFFLSRDLYSLKISSFVGRVLKGIENDKDNE